MAINIPNQLKYTEDHDWVAVDGDTITIGLSDFAQQSLGDIVFVELPEVGSELSKGDSFGVVESVKSVSDLLIPASAEITEVNEALSEQPELCNSAPYDSWIIKAKVSNQEELNGLMDAEQYQKHCDSQE
jgi:glycine cleavage system H protein